jgi:glycosyltransferase involved in cell wall biosynthesis
MAPQLSICIPTYNRRGYLEGVLAALAPIRARVDAEVVVSDDASSDDTASFLGDLAARDRGLRVLRQPKRLGGFANTIEVLRAARGRFTVYHADDDRLAEDGLVEALGFLEANPAYAAYYAPVQTVDLATDQLGALGLHTAEVADFDHAHRLELVAYVAAGLTPEHAVYRTTALASVAYDPQIYWSLILLHAALNGGRVRFAPTPFYRATLSHWPGELRPQLFQQMMADMASWETFRAGLEMILAAQPGILAERARIAQARALIDRSIGQRQSLALDFLSAQARWIEFIDVYRVLALRDALPRAFADLDLLRLSMNAIATVILSHASLHGFARVVLTGLRELAPILTEALGATLPVSTAPELAAVAADAGTLLVVADAAMAEAAVARGAARHAVRDFAALYAAYDLLAAGAPV